MGFLEACISGLQRIDRQWLSALPPVCVPSEVSARTAKDPLVIADAGSAGGLDPRWEKLEPGIRHLTFEPRAESAAPAANRLNFPICLGDQPGHRTLYLAEFEQASSLYALDLNRLGHFLVHGCLESVGTQEVEVSTLDRCLEKHPDWHPHFLKVDVEGADLDVLKGADHHLRSHVLGVQVEVSFNRRHVGGPLFGEIDAFLRDRGFELFGATRDHMIRRNGVHGACSHPQLMWGDGLYFLSRETLLARLESADEPGRERLLRHFTLLLLAYGIHDFPQEIIESAQATGVVPAPLLAGLEEAVQRSSRSLAGHLGKLIAGAALATGICLVGILPTRSRGPAICYFKRRWGNLFHALWRITARGGPLNGSLIDPNY